MIEIITWEVYRKTDDAITHIGYVTTTKHAKAHVALDKAYRKYAGCNYTIGYDLHVIPSDIDQFILKS